VYEADDARHVDLLSARRDTLDGRAPYVAAARCRSPILIARPSRDQVSPGAEPIQARFTRHPTGLLRVAGRSILFDGRNKFERLSPT
jgi:hypothetical protein